MKEKTLEERYWPRINKTDSCWIWTHKKDKDGYGRFFYKGKYRGAHRVAYLLANGNLPDDLLVCHKCDNPSCVNPEHLFLGTIQDNHLDMQKKNRQATGLKNGKHTHPELKKFGEENPSSKLNETTVRTIREMYKIIKSQRKIAKHFNISRSCVRSILINETWQHLK